jgi:hypothetical protein
MEATTGVELIGTFMQPSGKSKNGNKRRNVVSVPSTLNLMP